MRLIHRGYLPAPKEFLGLALTSPMTLVVLWAMAIRHSWVLLKHLQYRVGKHDFSEYYLSSLAFRQHCDAYITTLNHLGAQLGLQVGDLDRAAHPPIFLLLFEPLTLLTPLMAYWVWIALNFVCLMWAIGLLQSDLSLRVRLFLFPLALLYAPLSSHFHWAQNNLLILLLLAGFAWSLEAGYEGCGGILLSLAAGIRLFPILLIGYPVLQRKWKMVCYFLLGSCALGLVTIILMGAIQSLHFSHGMATLADLKWLTYTNNASVRAFVTRLCWSVSNRGDSSLQGARYIAIFAVQLAILVTTIRISLISLRRKDDHQRVLCLWIVASMLLSPTAWDHYMVLLLVMFYTLTRARLHGRVAERAIYAAIASYLCSDIHLIVSTADLRPKEWLLATLSEKDFIALSLAYLSAYWFAHDSLSA
jgi:Glycosyltransferase family 87